MPSLLTTQAALALTALPVLATWPPARGPILLVPVTAEASRTLAARALNGSARLLARGPLPGSLVVDGTRARLRAVPGTLLFSAANTACGAAR